MVRLTPDELREKAASLPLAPGVYLMLGESGEVIYVGKAKKLKNRVSQYFQDSAAHGSKTRAMVRNVRNFDVILADSEFEALILENSLIKRHMPKYNILLKDDKGYPYLRLSVRDPYPKFTLAGRKAEDGARYFGPYGSRGTAKQIIRTLCGAMRLPVCGKKFPRDIGKGRPCLHYHMGNCDGYCRPEMDQSKYLEGIGRICLILEGKYREVVEEMRAGMERAAEELRFEQAAALRDRIAAVEALKNHEKVGENSAPDTDVFGLWQSEDGCCLVVLRYDRAGLADKEVIPFEKPVEEGGEILSTLLRQYYVQGREIPRSVILPDELEDREDVERLLCELAERKVTISVPQRGDRRAQLLLAEKNAAEEGERAVAGKRRVAKILPLLGQTLGICAPVRIEAFDISNTGKSEIVAAMTVFQNGKPLKRDYRRFRIKEQEGPDDYSAMREALTRRFLRARDGDEKFAQWPDLLLIDGGVLHARVAEEVLASFGHAVPVFGMVKDGRHRTRALVRADGREIGLGGNPALFAFIGQIQEETHRFAITFHRERRAKQVRRSELDGVPGVGERRKTALLEHFKSISAIRKATEEELSNVVPKPVAQAIRAYFESEE